MPHRKEIASPYLYKVCLLGAENEVFDRLAEVQRALSPPERPPARGPFARLARMAVDKLSSFDRADAIADALRSMPQICGLTSNYRSKILASLRVVGPSLSPLSLRNCLSNAIGANHSATVAAILDLAGPERDQAWTGEALAEARGQGAAAVILELSRRQARLERGVLEAQCLDGQPAAAASKIRL